MRNSLIRLLTAILTVILLLAPTACGKDEEWISTDTDKPSASGDQIPQNDSADAIEGEYPAPVFRSGRYRMVSSSVSANEYSDETGKIVYTESAQTKYTYDLDITVSEAGITCRYTFAEVYGTSSEDGSESVLIDTTDDSLRNDSTQVFYDLIGRSFTALAAPSGKLSAVIGVSDILSAVPAASSLISEELMFSMASDLFYEMPEKFTADTGWQLEQNGMVNAYSLSRMARGCFGISVSGGESTVPEPYTDSSGYTTTYSSVEPLTGFLWMDQQDRAVQELTSSQRSKGMFSDSEGNGAYFTSSVSSGCTITAA